MDEGEVRRPSAPLPVGAATDPADPGGATLLDMHTSGGSPAEMTATQIRDTREYLLRDHFAFSYIIAGNKDLYPPVHGPLSELMRRWGTPEWRRIMVQVPRSAFKCLAVGQLVHTPSGPVSVETLRPGDTVWGLSDHGKLQHTTVLRNSIAKAPLLEITLRTGHTVRVTPN